MNTPTCFIFDFDSTFIQSEGLEELAALALTENPQKESILKKMTELTEQGMNGEIPYDISLRERIKLLQATKADVEKLGELLKGKISPSILRNKTFFKTHKDQIYIISGGFKEFIVPVVKSFGIAENHVFGNTFIYDAEGTIVGIDTNNPLSQEQGKVKLIQSLDLHGDIAIIGDGYTDYKVKESGLAKQFIAYTENIARKPIMQKADHVAATFDEFNDIILSQKQN